MRGLVQRVSSASVTVRPDGGPPEVIGRIGGGLCVLVGVTHGDDAPLARRLADKLWHLRVFPYQGGAMNVSAAARSDQGDPVGILVVSQFTLYGDTDRGRRPSFVRAAPPEVAEPLVEVLVEQLGTLGAEVAVGRFRADMAVELVNDGPVTLMLEV